ncbi:hypothetical protein FQR65_LT07095 [Abscondita terminalis]|nr:hypothetical protein FQR65_LT07095 [Abscondita terminalis]
MDFANVNVDDFITEIEKEPSIWNSAIEEYSNKIIKKNSWERVILKFVEDFSEKCASEKSKIGIMDEHSEDQTLQTNPQSSPNVNEIDAPQPTPKKRRNAKSNRTVEHEEEELVTVLKRKIINDKPEPKESDPDTLFMLSLVPELKQFPSHTKFDIKCDIMKVLQRAKLEQSTSSSYYTHALHEFRPDNSQFIQPQPSTSNYHLQQVSHSTNIPLQNFSQNVLSTSQRPHTFHAPSPAESQCSTASSDVSTIDWTN